MKSFTIVGSTHLLKYYVIVMIYLALDLLAGGLIGPIKSTAHLSNTWKINLGLNFISSLLDGFPTLCQTSQFWQYSFESL
jgi:hypothetical protein